MSAMILDDGPIFSSVTRRQKSSFVANHRNETIATKPAHFALCTVHIFFSKWEQCEKPY